MEIYRNSSNATVSIKAPVTLTAAVVRFISNGLVLHEASTVTFDGVDTYSVTIPWHITRQDQDFIVEWTYSFDEHGVPHTLTERVEVQIVTPLLSLDEIARIAEKELPADLDYVTDLERKVRFAIQTISGQNFGKWYGVMSSSGNGSNRLLLPAPILDFTRLSFDGAIRSNWGLTIILDGWGLSGGTVEINSIKQAPPDWMLDRFDYDGKIRAPMVYDAHRFHDGVEYVVEGLWGYRDVPADIKQAARLLVSDYACDESLWRDRYIDSIRAGEWRFEFNPNAFTGTGNVQVDQILANYRKHTLAVI